MSDDPKVRAREALAKLTAAIEKVSLLPEEKAAYVRMATVVADMIEAGESPAYVCRPMMMCSLLLAQQMEVPPNDLLGQFVTELIMVYGLRSLADAGLVVPGIVLETEPPETKVH